MASTTASPSCFRSLQHPTVKYLPVKSMDPPDPVLSSSSCCNTCSTCCCPHPPPTSNSYKCPKINGFPLELKLTDPTWRGPEGPHVTLFTTGFPEPHRTHSVLSRIPSWPRNKTSCLSPNPAAWKTTRPRCPWVCSRKARDFPWAMLVYRRALVFFTYIHKRNVEDIWNY